MHHSKISVGRAYLAWSSMALFYFFQYMLRVSPGVMELPIREALGITADQFGTLGSYYLYAYGALQIPLGIIIDRIGIKKTALWSVILCCLGNYCMSVADTLWMAQLSRILIGCGSACAFMGALKIAADFLPAGKRGVMLGLTLALGTLGAIAASKPLVVVSEMYSWRTAILLTTLLGIVVLFLISLLVPNRKHPAPDNEIPSHKEALLPQLKQNLKDIFKNKHILIYGLLTVGLYSPLSALADLWGTAYLAQSFNLSRGDAAQTSMMIYVGLTLGCFTIPWICEKYNKINFGIRISCYLVIICFGVLLYAPFESIRVLQVLLFTIGFLGSAEMLCFTGALFHARAENSGLIIGFVNMMNMIGGAFLQQFIGTALDISWKVNKGGLTETGIRTYKGHDFQLALSVIIVLLIVCIVYARKLKTHHPKPPIQAA